MKAARLGPCHKHCFMDANLLMWLAQPQLYGLTAFYVYFLFVFAFVVFCFTKIIKAATATTNKHTTITLSPLPMQLHEFNVYIM